MGYHPFAVLLPQAQGQSEPAFRGLGELLLGPAAQQCPGERCVLALGHVELDDVEHRAGGLPSEERRPRLAIALLAADPLVRRWNVEHDDVVSVSVEHRVELPLVNGAGPGSDQLLYAHTGVDSTRAPNSSAPTGGGTGAPTWAGKASRLPPTPTPLAVASHGFSSSTPPPATPALRGAGVRGHHGRADRPHRRCQIGRRTGCPWARGACR